MVKFYFKMSIFLVPFGIMRNKERHIARLLLHFSLTMRVVIF